MSLNTGLGRPILTQSDLASHVAALATQDVIYWPLYDALSWGTAGQTLLSYFANPQGAGTTSAPGAGSGPKTSSDTNMQLAGQLPLGNDFFFTGLEFDLYPGESPEQVGGADLIGDFVNDVWLASKSGLVTFVVQNRNYIQDGPLLNFPPACGLSVAAAIGGTNTAGTQSLSEVAYAVASGMPYTITPVYIQATQGFQMQVTWPAVVSLSSTARMFSRMQGYLIRNVQ